VTDKDKHDAEDSSQSPRSSAVDEFNHDASGNVASNNDATSERTGTGFLAVMQSVGAAMIGVQSKKNKERDFTHGKPLHFIIGGLIGTFIFLLCIWGVVQYLIATN